MTEYFAVLGGGDRRGPFNSIGATCRLLKQIAKDRGLTKAQAYQFFRHESVVEQVETLDGKVTHLCVGWMTREMSGVEELPLTEEDAFLGSRSNCPTFAASESQTTPAVIRNSSLRITTQLPRMSS